MKEDELTMSEDLMADSRFSQTSTGGSSNPPLRPTNGQKWWASVLLGLLFFIISSPSAYDITGLGCGKVETPLLGLIIHTIIFILIVRIILW